MTMVPFGSPLDSYERQAAELLAGWKVHDPEAVKVVRNCHPRFLDERIRWLPLNLSEAELRAVTLDLEDAQLALARAYSFQDWPSLVAWVAALSDADSPVARFESAVQAVVAGDVDSLERALRTDPDLVTARSTIVACFDPPEHRATLLHYVAANGVEGWRQKSPANAVDVATVLLRAGAEPDALAPMYGGQWTTMGLLVSSSHPAQAGVQAALAETLLDFGSAIEGPADDPWMAPLMISLAFGYLDTAHTLVRRGAAVTNLAAAAGLGQLEAARELLRGADELTRHKALALAAQHGHTEIVRLLLEAGEDPNRYNPPGNHAHSTPLHQAVWGDHLATVKLLVSRGARLDIPDTIYQSTPVGWAEFGGHTAIAEFLRAM